MVPTLPGIPGKPGNSQISLPVGKKSGIWLIITEIREIVTENRDKIVCLAKKRVPPFLRVRRAMNQGNTEINIVNDVLSKLIGCFPAMASVSTNEIASYKCTRQSH